MGNLLNNSSTDAAPLDKDDKLSGSRSPVVVYNGAQPSGTKSAQGDETEPTMRRMTLWRQTMPHIPNVLTTPTNVSSPIPAGGPSAPSGPSAYPTTLESTLDVVTEQPTSQMNEPDVTPDLFSPTISGPTSIFEIPKPTTIIPETPYQPTIFETSMDRTPAPQSA